LAEEHGLIAIQRRPEEDKRKDFLRLTAKLIDLVNRELGALKSAAEREFLPDDRPAAKEGTTISKVEKPFAQLVSQRLGIPMEQITVVHGNTDSVEFEMSVAPAARARRRKAARM
jgi:CO/xanthine dehydrogenase Mo-binding subunit